MKTRKLLLVTSVFLAIFVLTFVHAEADRNSTRDRLPEAVTPISNEDLLKNVPNFFYFDYAHEPMPGERLWLRISAEKWVERYPDGTESTFIVLGHAVVDNIPGTILIKVTGDPDKTDTVNDGGFQAFIPDMQNQEKHFKYRNSDRGDKQWSDLGEMKGIK